MKPSTNMKSLHSLLAIALLGVCALFSTALSAQETPDYFKITATQGTSTVYLYKKGTPAGVIYCTKTPDDNTSWVVAPNASGDAIELVEGQSLYFKGDETNKTNGVSTGGTAFYSFHFKGTDIAVSAGGNIMSLVDPNLQDTTTIPTVNCFYYLFGTYISGGTTYSSSAALTDVSNLRLPATTLKNYCYGYMFKASGITTCFKELPATTVTTGAYTNMFNSCTALIKAPNIKATTISSNSFESMFNGCSALVTGPDTLYSEVIPISGCTAMFYGCSSLKYAPIIMAKTPRAVKGGTNTTNQCLKNCAAMFQNCGSLDTITCYFEEWYANTTNGNQETYSWVSGVKTKGVFYNPYQSYITKNPTRGSIHYIPQNSSSYKWEVRAFWDYTFNLNEGTWSDNTTQDSVKRSYVDLPYNSTNKDTIVTSFPKQAFKAGGYEFVGWNIDKDASPSATSGWLVTNKRSGDFIYDNQTYYAIYREIAISADITFNSNGGTWEDQMETESTIILPSPVSVAPVVRKADYEFDEWNTSADGSGSSFVSNNPYQSDITFYAVWKPTFTFSLANGGTWDGSSTKDSIMTIAKIAVLTTDYPIAQRDNFSLVGYNTLQGATTNNFDKSNLPTTPQTYYAIYTANFTFNPNGGSWDGSEDVANRVWTKDELLTSPSSLTDPIRAGYQFLGWFDQPTGGNPFPGAESLDITVPQTFYAHYAVQYTFDPNGGTWEDESTDSKIFYGDFSLPSLSRNGYTFAGWSPVFNPASLPDEPTTYTAQWTPINYTFDVATNGGAWQDASTSTRVYNIEDIASLEKPVKEKQSFFGWKDGSGNPLNLAALPSSPTTFYAQFGEMQYLCITALHDNVQIGTYYVSNTVTFDLSYSTDGIEWTKAYTNTRTPFVTLANKGDKVYLKGNNPKGINSNENSANYMSNKYVKFTISDSATISGNIMTLINAEEPPLTISYAYTFAKLFTETHLVHASDLLLPATELANGCYEAMFLNCTKLIDAPQFGDFTTIPYAAFKSMFYDCSSLTIAPEFTSVTEVEGIGCQTMFYGCTSLVEAPALMATTLAKDCYQGMFYNCSSLRSMNVAFTSWGNNNNYYTSNWMYGTTTNPDDHAEFGCIGLPILRGTSNIQENWKVVIPDIVVNEDAYSSEIINGANIFLTNGATLTLDNNFTPVKMSVAAGCKLTIPESYTLTTDTIILQGGDTTNGTYRYLTPEMVVNGHIQTSTGTATPILYDYLLNDAQYYTLALPYDVTISDITYLDGTSAVIGIQDYDGATRVQGKSQGAWRTIYTNDPDVTRIEDATTLSAGRGYTIYAVPETSKTYSRVRFPMHPNFITAPEAQKSVSVYGYGCAEGKPTTEGNENNVGWNLIGNPYLATFGNSWVTLRMNEAEVVDYVIIPANDGRSYHPELMINASLPAFKNFFVQVFENGTLSFDINTRAQQSPSRAPMTSTRIFAGITLSGNGQEDKMGLTLRDDYTEGYDPYADLSKWMNNGLNLYATVGGNNLTMAAVSADRAHSAIPLVVNTVKAGTLTFTLNHAWDMNIDELEHLYLEDKETGIITDLLSDSYAYEAAKGTTEGRFFLTAVRRNTPTSNEQLQPATATDVVKFIRDGRLFILRNNRFYNAQGQIIR